MSADEDGKKPGLRERKREQLRATVERAALDLMLEQGYDAVTVEMICEAAEVSRRTFFNYFGSKETVVLGRAPEGPSPEDQQAFVHGTHGTILADLARMLLKTLQERPHDVDPARWRDRLALIRATPELAMTLADTIAAKDADLLHLVGRRIRARYAAEGVAEAPGRATDLQITRQAEVIVALWWGIARYTMQTIVQHPETDTEELIESLLDTLTLIQEAEL